MLVHGNGADDQGPREALLTPPPPPSPAPSSAPCQLASSELLPAGRGRGERSQLTGSGGPESPPQRESDRGLAGSGGGDLAAKTFGASRHFLGREVQGNSNWLVGPKLAKFEMILRNLFLRVEKLFKRLRKLRVHQNL